MPEPTPDLHALPPEVFSEHASVSPSPYWQSPVNRATQVFLATQTVDEARHLEVLVHRLGELGVGEPDAEIERRASPELRRFRERLLAFVDSGDWEAALFARNVILESAEFAVFHRDACSAPAAERAELGRDYLNAVGRLGIA